MLKKNKLLPLHIFFMTILLLIKRFDVGGAENHVCDLANSLKQKGHNVILVAGKGRQAKKLLPGIKYYPVKLKDLHIPYHIFMLARLIFKHRVNVIHAHQRLAILNACLAGFLTRRKVIATVHGRSQYDLRHFISRHLLSKVIFVSKKVLKASNQRYNIADKSVLIHNGVKIHSAENISPVPFRLCYTSKINKPHFRFLEFMIEKVLPQLKQKYPLLELWILGDGKRIEELKLLADKFNNTISSKYCNVLGYKNSVVSYYKEASLVLGVGRVAMEASSIGIPVLSVNSKRMGGLLGAGKYESIKDTNFIDTNALAPSSESVLATIEEFFENPQKWKKEAEIVKSKIQKELSIEQIAEKIISLYNEVAETENSYYALPETVFTGKRLNETPVKSN